MYHARGEKQIHNLIGIAEGKKPLGRTKNKWRNNIKMDLKEIRCGCVD
jgi:hypothetical protein